jgi:hypothetical protein
VELDAAERSRPVNDDLRKMIREQAEAALAGGRNLEIAPELALRCLDWLIEAEAKFEELAALTCGVRHYARQHGLPIGECVAWTVLKKELGVGQSDEADDQRWEAYRKQEGTALANYGKRRRGS